MSDLFQAVPVYPLTFEIARLAARIGGEAQRKGAAIPFQDLVIGVTALHDPRPGCKIPVVTQGAPKLATKLAMLVCVLPRMP